MGPGCACKAGCQAHSFLLAAAGLSSSPTSHTCTHTRAPQSPPPLPSPLTTVLPTLAIHPPFLSIIHLLSAPARHQRAVAGQLRAGARRRPRGPRGLGAGRPGGLWSLQERPPIHQHQQRDVHVPGKSARQEGLGHRTFMAGRAGSIWSLPSSSTNEDVLVQWADEQTNECVLAAPEPLCACHTAPALQQTRCKRCMLSVAGQLFIIYSSICPASQLPTYPPNPPTLQAEQRQ